MKTSRLVHVSIGIVAVGLLLLMGWGLFSSQLRNEEQSRVENVQNVLEKKLDAYYKTKDEYPGSLQVLGLTNSQGDALVLRAVRRTTYHHTRSSYTLSYDGSFHSAYSISNAPMPSNTAPVPMATTP